MAGERVSTVARGVSVREGAMALTRTAGASSAARERVRPSMPPEGVGCGVVIVVVGVC